MDNSGGNKKRIMRSERTKAKSSFMPFAFFMTLLDLATFFTSLPYPEIRRRRDIMTKEKRARDEDDTVFTSV